MTNLFRVCGSALALLSVASIAWAQQSAAPAGFFFDVQITLRENGSGTLRLSYPVNPVMNPATERERFLSPVTEVTSVDFTEQLVRTTISFTDFTRLAEAPELRSITAKRQSLGDGRERLEARLRSYTVFDAATEAPLTISVQFPGALVEANTEEIKGSTATWRPPAKDFFTESGITLEAVYRPVVANVPAEARPN